MPFLTKDAWWAHCECGTIWFSGHDERFPDVVECVRCYADMEVIPVYYSQQEFSAADHGKVLEMLKKLGLDEDPPDTYLNELHARKKRAIKSQDYIRAQYYQNCINLYERTGQTIALRAYPKPKD